MRDHEAAMEVYARLAGLSAEKQQGLARDRFLLLAGVEACRAGWLDVAAECHRLLKRYEPHHHAAKYASFAEALQGDEFRGIVEHWERWCPFERAEHLLQPWLKSLPVEPDHRSIGERCLESLSQLANSSDSANDGA